MADFTVSSDIDSLMQSASVAAARTVLQLGTASLLNAGTGASNLVQLDGTGKLPAVDGSALLNLPSSGGDLLSTNNLSDLTDAPTARTNLGLGLGSEVTFAGLSVGSNGTLLVYSDLDDPGGNYERLSISMDTNGDVTFAMQSGGSGAARQILFYHGSSNFEIQNSIGRNIRFNSGNILPTSSGNSSLGGPSNLFNVCYLKRLNQQTSSAADPTTTEYPNDRDGGWHKNTTSGNVFIAYNDGGTIKKVQLT